MFAASHRFIHDDEIILNSPLRADICNSAFGIGQAEIILRALMRRSYVYARLIVKTSKRSIKEKKVGDSNFSADCRYIGMPSVAGDTRYTRPLYVLLLK